MESKTTNGDLSNGLSMDNVTVPVHVEDQSKRAVFTPAQDFDFMDDPKFNGTVDQGSGKFNDTSDTFHNVERPAENPKKTPFSPFLLRRSTNQQALTAEDTQVDPNLVASERYDPQSKAFSYVPVRSLEDHFRSPKKATKLVPVYEQQEQQHNANNLPFFGQRTGRLVHQLDNTLLDPDFYLKFENANGLNSRRDVNLDATRCLPAELDQPHTPRSTKDHLVNNQHPLGELSGQLIADVPNQYAKAAVHNVYKPEKSWADAIGDTFIYDTPSKHYSEYQKPLHVQTPPNVSCQHCGHGIRSMGDGAYGQTVDHSLVAHTPSRSPEPHFRMPSFWQAQSEGQTLYEQASKVAPKLNSVDYYLTPDSSALSTPTGGPVSRAEWLDRQMKKLRMKQLEDDADLKIRKEQERLLLEELKHIHDEKLHRQNNAEPEYVVEGYGMRTEDEQDRTCPHYSMVVRKNLEQQHHLAPWTKPNYERYKKPLSALPPYPGGSRERRAAFPVDNRQPGYYKQSVTHPRQRMELDQLTDFENYQPFTDMKSLQPAPSPKSILKKPRSIDAEVPSTSQAFVVGSAPSRYNDEIYGKQDIDQHSKAFEDIDSFKHHNRLTRATTPAFPVHGRAETPMPYHPLLYQQQNFLSQAGTPLPGQADRLPTSCRLPPNQIS